MYSSQPPDSLSLIGQRVLDKLMPTYSPIWVYLDQGYLLSNFKFVNKAFPLNLLIFYLVKCAFILARIFNFFLSLIYDDFLMDLLKNYRVKWILIISNGNVSFLPSNGGRNDIVHHPREPMMDWGVAEVIIGSRIVWRNVISSAQDKKLLTWGTRL